ncbi:glycoside hydrolase family 2 TIM barrel-domain containing protein [Spirosoma pollinicola]|uniref:Glycoside hydrolase family 2 n=1 Tax=Spirosoma pollinicola TaxID=2057025 RepID=A0A2K8ZAI7_9BACT|nr:glycoside hydrolase family 2 TIM barrel-domain containing protein [Spirosoma pollinicola]AUD06865.1 glycoside hydrolase family 2 [Spirosoma pollinicola]
MRTLILIVCLLSTLETSAQPGKHPGKSLPTTLAVRTQLFDQEWVFLKDSVSGAEQPEYDDSGWRRLRLPHDWSIEDLPGQGSEAIVGPFSKTSVGATSTGYAVGGTGWYRKTFTLKSAYQAKNISIQFDGVYRNVDVWLNGHHLGYHAYGYTPFVFDLTPYLRPADQPNVLAVRVRNEGQNTRWYTGSGIYRHVWLTIAEPVHLAPWGIVITTPQVSSKAAQVQISTNVKNDQASAAQVTVQVSLQTSDGQFVKDIKKTVTLTDQAIVTQTLSIPQPTLWSVDTPYLYRATITIWQNNRKVDSLSSQFGIRTIHFDAQTGFTLNGRRILLKGGCVHHDNGPLGAVAIDRAEERKVELLKANGFNAVRSSHNPPSPAFLDACDRLGMLVIDEAFDMWERLKKPHDYHLDFDTWWERDLTAMIQRDRNHPSIILWSIGNEISERADSSGLVITKKMVSLVHKLDLTRPTTEAICSFWEHPGMQWDASAKAFALLDVGGYNYEWKHYESDHQQFPNRIMVGTETFAKEAFENWQQVEKHPYVIGDFVWTAMDYMGETAIGHSLMQPKSEKDSTTAVLPWPWFNAYCGDLDLIGTKKPQSYYRDVVWRNSPIQMAVHAPIPNGMKESVTNWGWPDEHQSWTWPGAEGKPLQVRVFTRSSRVQLLLNGHQIGDQTLPDSSIVAIFSVPYQPGTLEAVSLHNGQETGRVRLTTTSAAHHIRLTADRPTLKAGPDELAYISAEVVDAQENTVPTTETSLSFQVSGEGYLAAVGNGNPTDMASFQQPERKTYRGRCLAIIRPGETKGIIKVKASANGLQSAEITLVIH